MDNTNYKRVNEKPLPKKPISDNAENRHWHSLKSVHDQNYDVSVKCINARNNTKNHIAISNGTGVEIFSTSENKVIQSLQRFKQEVTSIQYRNDAQLLAVGLDDGQIQIMNMLTKTPLRIFKQFKKAVHSLCFDEQKLYAGSDQGIIKLFDVSSEQVIRSIPDAHQDFIRSISTIDNLLLTSSYDMKVKVFDFRSDTNEPVKVFNLLHPVEQVMALPNGYQFVTAQDQWTSLWDIRNDLVSEIQVNQKTVTCLTMVSYQDTYRILTGSLDHQMKYIRPDIFTVTHQQKWNEPILALDCTTEGSNIAIGGSNGKLEILQMTQTVAETLSDEDHIPEFLKSNPHLQRQIKDYKYYNRGIYSKNTDYDVKINHNPTKPFTGFDKLLVQFRYKDAILKAFREKKSAMILSLYEELSDRGALQIALRNLAPEELSEIVLFIEHKITNPKFAVVMIQFLNILLDLYSNEILTDSLVKVLNQEYEVQQQLLEMKGMIKLLI